MATSQDSLLRVLLVVLAVLILLPVVTMGMAMPMMGMWFGGGPGMGFSSITSLVVWLLVLALLVGLGFLLYRSLSGGITSGDPALEELRIAYARGEVSEEEYETRRERLRREE